MVVQQQLETYSLTKVAKIGKMFFCTKLRFAFSNCVIKVLLSLSFELMYQKPLEYSLICICDSNFLRRNQTAFDVYNILGIYAAKN